MSFESNMDFWLSLYGDNIDLPKIEEALQVKLEDNRIIAPEELSVNSNCPIFYEQIAWLLDLVEKNKGILLNLGVNFSESEIWMVYYYDKQCNMEFDAVLLERMGKLGLKLCVSCVSCE
ncbi:MAG: hypothetical protein ACI4YB_11865 [Oscillospiraceae bacterium]